MGPLVVVEGTLDQDGYVNLMSKHLVPCLRRVNEKCPGVIFQDDNAPYHAAKYPTWWLQTHSIERLPWPAQSPDLNPIEHLWDHLDRQVRKRNPLPTSSAAMVAALHEEWGRIPLSVVRKLITSVPKRLEAVRKAKGLATRY